MSSFPALQFASWYSLSLSWWLDPKIWSVLFEINNASLLTCFGAHCQVQLHLVENVTQQVSHLVQLIQTFCNVQSHAAIGANLGTNCSRSSPSFCTSSSAIRQRFTSFPLSCTSVLCSSSSSTFCSSHMLFGHVSFWRKEETQVWGSPTLRSTHTKSLEKETSHPQWTRYSMHQDFILTLDQISMQNLYRTDVLAAELQTFKSAKKSHLTSSQLVRPLKLLRFIAAVCISSFGPSAASCQFSFSSDVFHTLSSLPWPKITKTPLHYFSTLQKYLGSIVVRPNYVSLWLNKN